MNSRKFSFREKKDGTMALILEIWDVASTIRAQYLYTPINLVPLSIYRWCLVLRDDDNPVVKMIYGPRVIS